MLFYVKLSKLKFLYVFFAVLTLTSFNLRAKAAVTYSLTGGRFGDHLLSFLRAEWIAYSYNIDLKYRPFKYSNELALDLIYKRDQARSHNKHVHLDSKNFNIITPDDDILYTVPYFPESTLETEKNPSWKNFYFPVNWKDSDFRKNVLEKIKPVNNIKTIIPPRDCVSVALHVREGGGRDSNTCFSMIPFKFPPMQFYKDALMKVINCFENKAIYCFVFTDALNPKEIISQLQSSVNNASVIFDYRKENNSPVSNVLEDFFSFFNFDVLIRPDSNFSIIPSLLNDYAIIVSPKHIISLDRQIVADDFDLSIDNTLIIVDDFNIAINENLLGKLLNDPRLRR